MDTSHLTAPSSFSAAPPRVVRQTAFGLAAIGIGLLALADNLQLSELRLLHTFWPVALVLLGLGKLFGNQHRGLRIGGVAMVIVGTMLTAMNLGLFAALHLRQGWPLVPIAVGVLLLLRAWLPRR